MPLLAPIKFRPTPASVEAYRAVLAEKVALSEEIPAQHMQGAQAAVWRCVMAGGDLATLSIELQKYGLDYKRAAAIARHQCSMAKAVMENVRRLELGLTEAIWMHSGAGRSPRPSHIAYSGKRFKLATGAFLDGKWVWPGSEPDCLCTSRPVIEGFED
jgi:uncharacterized protein with gpF-like domain